MPLKPDQVPIAAPRSFLRKGRADQRQAARHQQRARRCPAPRAPRSAAGTSRDKRAADRGQREERRRRARRRGAGRSGRRARRRPAAAPPATAHRPRPPIAPATAVASSRRWIAGSATLTTVPSMKAMLEPRIVATSVQRRAASPQSTASPRVSPSQGWLPIWVMVPKPSALPPAATCTVRTPPTRHDAASTPAEAVLAFLEGGSAHERP